MSYRDKRHERKAHPGWAVQFVDGSWLGGAHGWFTSEEAFYADTYDSEEKARSTLEYVRKNHKEDSDFAQDARIIPAWEVLAEHLRLDIHFLKKSSQVKRETVDDITEALEDALRTLKSAQEESVENDDDIEEY
jgi:hypothetical protein